MCKASETLEWRLVSTAELAYCMTVLLRSLKFKTLRPGVCQQSKRLRCRLESPLLNAVPLSIKSSKNPTIYSQKNPMNEHAKQLVLQRSPHHSLWGCSISSVFSLWCYLLIDIDNTDEEQDDHHHVIQDPQQSTEGGVCFQWTCWRSDGLQGSGRDGHHSPHTAQCHPKEKEPYESTHGAQASHQ